MIIGFIADDIPIHTTRPWLSVWILNLSEISPSSSSFRARLEYNVLWNLSDNDSISYITAIQNKNIDTWKPTWLPNFIPVNASSVNSMTREVYATDKDFLVMLQDDGLVGMYTLLIDATFTELFELRLFPYDVQDLAMDVQYHSYPQALRPLMEGCGDINLEKSTIKIHEKCYSSPEWIFHSVQMGFGVCKQQVRINVKLVRRWRCYVTQMSKILGFITLLAAFTTFIPSDTLSGQLSTLSCCLLAAIAYRNVVGSSMPMLPFSTILDSYVFSCITFIGFVMIKACILSILEVASEGKRREAMMVFGIDLAVWLSFHVCYLYISVQALKVSRKGLWTFPEPLLMNSMDKIPTPAGCVAILDKTGRRDDLKVQNNIEVYQKLIPTAYADIIYE